MDSVFLGFDHIDTRVASVRDVEPFYDELMPRLGLPHKRRAFVENDEWRDFAAGERYNVVEYYEPHAAGREPFFIGFIEDGPVTPSRTRIAFRIASIDALQDWYAMLPSLGARNIELSSDIEAYPAIFFDDPAGTKLELHACRRPQSASR